MLLMALASILGCEAQQEARTTEPNDPLFDPLARESSEIAFSYLELTGINELNCELKDVFRDSSEAPGGEAAQTEDLAQRMLEEFAQEAAALCVATDSALTSLRPRLEAIAEFGHPVEVAFAFSIFVRRLDDGDEYDTSYRAFEVLHFPDLASCEDQERVAREAGVPTRKCTRWTSSFDRPDHRRL
ncbi:MAG: hypothetical protein GY937_26520 [bacterium]|nr:hypothetical protein [bacterium]